jgi:hypothetical protein
MHPRFIVHASSLLLAGMGLSACLDEASIELELAEPERQLVEPAGGHEVASENQAIPVTYPVIACSSHNVIGELTVGEEGLSDRTCEIAGLPSAWTVRELFGSYTPELAAWTETRNDTLRRFCAFEYVGDLPEPALEHYLTLFDAIEQSNAMSLDTVEIDCLGQATMGTGLDTVQIHAELRDAYHHAIQWLAPEILEDSQHMRVFPEVAILDTMSQLAHDDLDIDPVNMHGGFMGDLAADIVCPGNEPDCLASIRYHVAMPREAYQAADYVEGGQHGTMGDLATALVAAVGQWRQARIADPSTTPRLVVSLSLGWDEGIYDPSRAPVRALETALKFAACNGAIVVAASGNVPDPECPNGAGPLAPAIYEEMPAPSEHECEEMGFLALESNHYPVFSGERPLLYAVGGVDAYDQSIINARPQSTPPLVGYASNVTVFSQQGGYTIPLTGTSVSAVQVASIAALLWSYMPEADPAWIMSKILDSGYPLNLAIDYGFDGQVLDARRVSVCRAMEVGCQSNHCPGLDCGMASDYLEPTFLAIETAIQDPGNTVEEYDGGDPVVLQCQPQTWDEQTKPQPEHPICPECVISSPDDTSTSNDLLSMTIKSAYQGSIVGIKLLTMDVNGLRSVFQFDANVISSVNSPTTNITQVRVEAPRTVSANLTFMLADGSSQDGPILVRPY